MVGVLLMAQGVVEGIDSLMLENPVLTEVTASESMNLFDLAVKGDGL